MSQVITNAFEQYWQSCLAAEKPVVLDEFILADIPNLDITSPIDPETGLPPESQIVHRQNVDQRGRINNNAVAYTIVMDTTVGDFSFNAMYLRNKQNGVIGMIVYKGRETKLKTDQTTGQTGNSLVKSMLMGYDQAAEATLTHVDAGTWQIDYAARLRGMDEDIRQLQADLYGHHTFVGDGFKVVEQDGTYQVTKGVAIIGGLRVELKAPEVIHPGTKPIGVWVDAYRAGSLLSEHQNHFNIITSVADLTDHVDSNGYQHYVAKLATVQVDGTIEDGRGRADSGSGGAGAIPDTFALWKRSMAEAGYDLIGQFGTEMTIETAEQVVLSKSGSEVYAWTGELPKYVPSDATLEGLEGTGQWIEKSGDTLRGQVAQKSGASIIGYSGSEQSVEKALNSLYAIKALIGERAITKLIPSDYPTLQDAVDALQKLYVMGNGVAIELRIEAGHKLTHGLLVQDGDFSKFIITSVDSMVKLSTSFIGVDTIDGPKANSSNGIITGMRARMPILSCIIDADGKAKNGYFAFMSSTGWLNRPPSVSGESPESPPIAGVINCAYFNIRAREGSTVYAENTVGYGAGINGYYANRVGTIHAEFSDAHGCGQSGFIANRVSKIVADSGNATGCKVGVQALRSSTISAELADATGCKIGFFSSYGCTITASQSKADNAVFEAGLEYSGSGYVAIRAGTLYAQDGSAKSCAGWGAIADDGGILELRGADVSLSIVGLLARFNSSVSAQSLTATGCPSTAIDVAGSRVDVTSMVSSEPGIGIRARFSSQVNALNANISGAITYGMFADAGSNICGHGASVKGSGTKDLRIQSGSFIVASFMETTHSVNSSPIIGDTNITAFNAMSASGAIFVN
ncbi:phage tail protein [Aeromonas dhakensis]|uniref:phage tail-collar fiber domain-containing protein n=2 Tax=Aeromonas dhakensis TaxID=196024 RepID=UPI00036FBC15|nr:phage tail protein [Aeromonas dhakensis]QSR44930.1 phage tail protein [Aeromonas dhakensis]